MKQHLFTKEEVDTLVSYISNFVGNRINANDSYNTLLKFAKDPQEYDEAIKIYQKDVERSNEILAEFLRSLTKKV